ncbi:Cell cycle checkpoint protein rad17, partial [Dissophora globulifera]
MPPKRARNKSPEKQKPKATRKAPTRNAKTRSAASTASMYKDSEAYAEFSSNESSDQISDPEEAEADSDPQESEEEDDDDDQDSDAFGTPIKSTTRTGRASKGPVKPKGKNSNSKVGKAQTVGRTAAKAGTSAAAATAAVATAKSSTRKVAAAPKPPAAISAIKRKAGNIRFASLGSSPASSSSSSTPVTTTPSSVISAPSSRANSTSKPRESNEQEDQWAEKYAPTDISEVAVHPGKIANDSSNRNQDLSGGAILVLSGPAGSGKTTVLKMLAQEMNLSIVEWINSVNENNVIQRPTMPGQDSWRPTSIDDEYIPVMKAFQEFFSRAQRFNPLGAPGSSTTPSAGSGGGPGVPLAGKGKKNIILIEDLPPISAFSSRRIFQDTITKFANTRTNLSAVLVIVVSDVFTKQSTELLFSNTSESRDPALTIRTLLPSSILDRIDSGGKGCARIKQI